MQATRERERERDRDRDCKKHKYTRVVVVVSLFFLIEIYILKKKKSECQQRQRKTEAVKHGPSQKLIWVWESRKLILIFDDHPLQRFHTCTTLQDACGPFFKSLHAYIFFLLFYLYQYTAAVFSVINSLFAFGVGPTISR